MGSGVVLTEVDIVVEVYVVVESNDTAANCVARFVPRLSRALAGGSFTGVLIAVKLPEEGS